LPTTILGAILVETLLECRELQRQCDSLPPCAEAESNEQRLARQEAIISYLQGCFAELNRRYLEAGAVEPAKIKAPIDVDRTRAELARMDDRSLLRYGTTLKYICVVEARLLDLPLDESEALLQEARAEWRRRFGDTAIAGSF
jgi:hypothetical protein